MSQLWAYESGICDSFGGKFRGLVMQNGRIWPSNHWGSVQNVRIFPKTGKTYVRKRQRWQFLGYRPLKEFFTVLSTAVSPNCQSKTNYTKVVFCVLKGQKPDSLERREPLTPENQRIRDWLEKKCKNCSTKKKRRKKSATSLEKSNWHCPLFVSLHGTKRSNLLLFFVTLPFLYPPSCVHWLQHTCARCNH